MKVDFVHYYDQNVQNLDLDSPFIPISYPSIKFMASPTLGNEVFIPGGDGLAFIHQEFRIVVKIAENFNFILRLKQGINQQKR